MNPSSKSTDRWVRHARRQPWPGAAVALALAATTVGGCLFQPRDAEPPGEKPPVPFVQPTAPEIALANMKKSLEAKYVLNYKNSFGEGELLMEMDPGEYVIAGGENPFSSWTREQEAERMQAVISSMGETTELVITWDPDYLSKWRSGDNFYEDLEYQLVFTDGQVVRSYAGRVNLYFEQVGANYYVVRWNDEIASGSTRTWCALRYAGQWNPAR